MKRFKYVMAACLLASAIPAFADNPPPFEDIPGEVDIVAGAVCDTPEQVKEFVSLVEVRDGLNPHEAEEKLPACEVAYWYAVSSPTDDKFVVEGQEWTVEKLLVVGARVDGKVVVSNPFVQYSAFAKPSQPL